MATCAACHSTILFGGQRSGDHRFCNDACLEKGQILITAESIDPGRVALAASEIHRGTCPNCGGTGPIDMHTSHTVWSLVFMTSWKSVPRLSCRGCGVRKQVVGLFSSALLGWWGIPWGIFMTPVQIGRNLISLAKPPAPEQPSDELLAFTRIMLAEGDESGSAS